MQAYSYMGNFCGKAKNPQNRESFPLEYFAIYGTFYISHSRAHWMLAIYTCNVHTYMYKK